MSSLIKVHINKSFISNKISALTDFFAFFALDKKLHGISSLLTTTTERCTICFCSICVLHSINEHDAKTCYLLQSYQEPPTSAVKSEPAYDDAYPGAGQVYDQWQRSITESRSNQSYSQAPDVKPATNQMGYSSQYDQGARSQNSQMQHSTGGHRGFSERPPVERDDVRQSSYGQNASYSQQGSRDMSASSVSRSTASDYADQRQPLQQGSRYERTPYQQSEFQQSQYQQSQYQQENYRQGQHQHGQYEQDQYQQQNQHGYSRPPAAQDNRKASTSQGVYLLYCFLECIC